MPQSKRRHRSVTSMSIEKKDNSFQIKSTFLELSFLTPHHFSPTNRSTKLRPHEHLTIWQTSKIDPHEFKWFHSMQMMKWLCYNALRVKFGTKSLEFFFQSALISAILTHFEKNSKIKFCMARFIFIVLKFQKQLIILKMNWYLQIFYRRFYLL